jgi:ribosome-associated protein
MAKKKATPVKKTAAKKVTTTPKKTATKSARPAAKKATVKTSVSKTKPAASKTKTATTKKVSAKAVKAVKTVSKTETKKIKGPTELLADSIVEGILEVKGRNISILNLTDIHNRVCDYFIICQADSNTQVNAIAGSVEEMVKKQTGERPYRKEGFENAEWILVDYVTVVVHIFQTEVRNFYNLESLWADAEVTQIAFDK